MDFTAPQFPEVVVGRGSSEHVTVAVLGPTPAGAIGDWNGKCLRARVRLGVGSFTGVLDADFRVDDLARFHGDLIGLYGTLEGATTLESVEEGLSLDLTGDGLGHIRLEGTDCDQPGNRLRFAIALDQTDLPNALSALKNLLDQFASREGK